MAVKDCLHVVCQAEHLRAKIPIILTNRSMAGVQTPRGQFHRSGNSSRLKYSRTSRIQTEYPDLILVLLAEQNSY